MLPFNGYSVPDLLALMVTAPLAVIFHIIYWGFGRRTVDLLFANWITCVAGVCVIMFLEDNVVPRGISAEQVPGAADLTLRLYRVAYAIGLLGMVTELHFVFRYCGVKWATARCMGLLYAVCFAAMPVIWTPWFITALARPIDPWASWYNANPCMPVCGPLVFVVLAAWIATQVLSLAVLWRSRHGAQQAGVTGALGEIMLVCLAFIVMGMGGLVDMLMALSGYAGVALLPLASLVMSAFVSIALVREKIAAQKERDRLEHELAIAADIQGRLPPKEEPAVAGFELVGWIRQAGAAGGDTYDFLQLRKGRWLIMLADASGHGLGPALFVAETRALVRALASQTADPSRILLAAADLIGKDLPDGKFVTCFVGVLDPAEATLAYASAGQGPIFFYSHQEDKLQMEDATTFPLMNVDGLKFSSGLRHHRFEPGDFMVLTSDGFYEAPNAGDEQFGLPRLLRAFQGARRLGASDILAQARQLLGTFVGGCAQSDDLTIVVLRKAAGIPLGAGQDS